MLLWTCFWSCAYRSLHGLNKHVFMNKSVETQKNMNHSQVFSSTGRPAETQLWYFLSAVFVFLCSLRGLEIIKIRAGGKGGG